MRLLAIDTSSRSTVVVAADGERIAEHRHDPADGERPGHTAGSLVLARAALTELGLDWSDLQRVGVGVGPGSFTGLRSGLAAAAGLARAARIGLVPIRATAIVACGARQGGYGPEIVAVLDGRRGELFYERFTGVDGSGVVRVASNRLDGLAGAVAGSARAVAVGDGALLEAEALRELGLAVPAAGPDGGPHRLRGACLAALAAEGEPLDPDLVRPQYGREPDAIPTAERSAAP